jgi:hypothetical protein
MAKEMAESMYGQTFQFLGKAGRATAAAGGFHRDHDVPQKDAIAGWVSLARKHLHMEAEHVGGAIDTAIRPIERANFVVIGEHQGGGRAAAIQGTQGQAQTEGYHLAYGRTDEAAGGLANDDINRHLKAHKERL